MRSLTAFFALAIAATTVSVAQQPGVVTGDTAVHDPTMCKDKDGKYWLFATAPGISIRSSTDRTDFKLEGMVWPDGAPWTNEYTNSTDGLGNLWAPDCYYSGGTFHLYYSASTFGSRKSAIFLAKSTTGAPGSWSDEGLVTSTSSYERLQLGDTWYLSLGSFGTGIQSLQVDPSTGKPTTSITSLARRTSGGGAVEASAVFRNGDFYYLFTSWDKCCSGTSSTYNIRVGRSSNPDGGFVDSSGVALTAGGGTLVLGTHDNIVGPGGQDLFDDGDGPILVYHYYTSSGSLLGINRLDFSSGWPVVV